MASNQPEKTMWDVVVTNMARAQEREYMYVVSSRAYHVTHRRVYMYLPL
jgi:hypothetical protein